MVGWLVGGWTGSAAGGNVEKVQSENYGYGSPSSLSSSFFLIGGALLYVEGVSGWNGLRVVVE